MDLKKRNAKITEIEGKIPSLAFSYYCCIDCSRK